MRTFLVLALSISVLPGFAEERPHIATLVKNLTSQDAAEAKKAGAELARLGQPALEELKRAAASGDGELSAKAAEVLDRFWTPPDLVPTDDAGMLRDIREEHDRLVAAGKEELAGELAKSWTDLRRKVAGFDVRSAKETAPEVHAVGFERGRVEKTRGARAEVEVSETGAPVVLVLSGKERVRWDVRVAQGADLRMVVVTGPVSQVVRGVPDSVPILRRIGTEGEPFAQATSVEDESFEAFAKNVSEWAGGEVLSLQGGEIWDGKPVQVGAANPSWGFQRSRARLAKLHRSATAEVFDARFKAARALRFPAVSHIEVHGDGLGPAEFSPEQVLAGTLHRTPRPVSHVTIDRDLGVLYAVSSQGAFVLDRTGHLLEEIAPGIADDVPGLDLPCGVAFDLKRRRLAVMTSGGDGVFYLFDPVARRWEAGDSLDGRNLSGLAYAPSEDVFYALEVPAEAVSSSTLVKLSHDGTFLGALRLSRPFPCRPGRPEQVVCVPTPEAPDGARFRLILLGAPVAASGGKLVRHCFVVEPSSGKVELAAEQDARVTGD